MYPSQSRGLEAGCRPQTSPLFSLGTAYTNVWETFYTLGQVISSKAGSLKNAQVLAPRIPPGGYPGIFQIDPPYSLSNEIKLVNPILNCRTDCNWLSLEPF